MNNNSSPSGESQAINFFIIAGEESGDLHGAQLVNHIKKLDPAVRFTGLGGDQMKAAGVELLEHVDNLAIMGFTEVIRHLSFFHRLMDRTVAAIASQRPQRIIVIDYPGFNLRLIKRIAGLGIPITYFILPQVWAWKENRVKILRKYLDQALCIFPFEENWFQQRNVPAKFVGHPFSDGLPEYISRDEFYSRHGLKKDEQLLVLFPGSRQQEVDRLWPSFLTAAQKITAKLPDIRIIAGRAPSVKLNPLPAEVVVEDNDPRLALKYGRAVLVASGTATLEAAVHDIPAVVAYRLSALTYRLARIMVKIKFVAMVNLVAERQVVPELLQNNFSIDNLADAVEPLLVESEKRNEMLSGYQDVRNALGPAGAYGRAAKLVLGQD